MSCRGLPSSDLRRKMPDIRDGEKRAFERGHRQAAGPPSGHHIAGDPTRRRRAGIPAGTGVEEGHQAPERGLFGPEEADGGALGEGRGEAGGGLEPGTGLGASPAGGPRHGRPSADIRPRTRGPQGRRNAFRAPAAAGERNRTGRVAATRAGVTSRAGGTSRSARKRSGRRRESATGKRTR